MSATSRKLSPNDVLEIVGSNWQLFQKFIDLALSPENGMVLSGIIKSQKIE